MQIQCAFCHTMDTSQARLFRDPDDQVTQRKQECFDLIRCLTEKNGYRISSSADEMCVEMDTNDSLVIKDRTSSDRELCLRHG